LPSDEEAPTANQWEDTAVDWLVAPELLWAGTERDGGDNRGLDVAMLAPGSLWRDRLTCLWR
jgi:hypothetical protein